MKGYYGDCQPKSLSLFSLAPRWLDFARSHQHSKTSKSEAGPVGNPQKVVVLEAWAKYFPCQGESGSYGLDKGTNTHHLWVCSFLRYPSGCNRAQRADIRKDYHKRDQQYLEEACMKPSQ